MQAGDKYNTVAVANRRRPIHGSYCTDYITLVVLHQITNKLRCNSGHTMQLSAILLDFECSAQLRSLDLNTKDSFLRGSNSGC